MCTKPPRGHGAGLMQGTRCPDLVRARNKPVPSERQPGSEGLQSKGCPGGKGWAGDWTDSGAAAAGPQLSCACLDEIEGQERTAWSSLLWRHTTTSALCGERSKKAGSLPPGLRALI